MLRNLNYRQIEVLKIILYKIKYNIKNDKKTILDQVECRTLNSILTDFWVIENKIMSSSGNGEDDANYLKDVSHHEKQALFNLRYKLNDYEDNYIDFEYELGLGQSVLVRELLASHFRQIRDYENQVDEDLEAEDK